MATTAGAVLFGCQFTRLFYLWQPVKNGVSMDGRAPGDGVYCRTSLRFSRCAGNTVIIGIPSNRYHNPIRDKTLGFIVSISAVTLNCINRP